MSRALETKACTACAVAKRKCGEQTPLCLRCRKGAISARIHQETWHSNSRQLAIDPTFSISEVKTPNVHLGLGSLQLLHDTLGIESVPTWFTSPQSWQIAYYHSIDLTSFSVEELKRLIVKVRQWLKEWVQKGSSRFMPARLYRSRFPRCIQDAYTALTCYLHKTASNEQTLLQIFEDRAKQLLAENGICSTATLPNLARNGSPLPILDPFDHLAHVQALLVYQVVCLYDGDIRLRHLAGRHMPVLSCWMLQTVERVMEAEPLGSSLVLPRQDPTSASDMPDRSNQSGLLGILDQSDRPEQSSLPRNSDLAHCENLFWYSWILAESIRRTCNVASGAQGVYPYFQQGSIACQGGMMITRRHGVLEVSSAMIWGMCSEVGVGFVQIEEADRLFPEAVLDEVDEFAKVMVQATLVRRGWRDGE